jgi:hypothetical protein
MCRKIRGIALLSGAVAIISSTEVVRATDPTPGYTTAFTIKGATVSEFEVLNHSAMMDLPEGTQDRTWLSLQKTKGLSDLYVVNNMWLPRSQNNNRVASTGWHSHPGHSLIVVTAGTITEYDGDCVQHIHFKGETFVDPGGSHVHILRNESDTVAASTLAIQLVPHDPNQANRRSGAPAPEGCADIE